MKSDLNQLIEMQDILSQDDFSEMAGRLPISVLIEQWDIIPDNIKIRIFASLHVETKADLLTNLTPIGIGDILLNLTEQEMRHLLTEIEPDDLADFVQTVDSDTRQKIWNGLSVVAKEETLFLLKFDEDDAAGIMNPRFLAIRSTISIRQALHFVRKRLSEVETIYYLYVIDNLKHLIGVVSLKDLLSHNDNTLISEIMETEMISVQADTDQEEVAKKLETYDLVSMPVVDASNKLLGIVTFDDVIDVIREEQTEDIYKMQAMGGQTERYMDTSVFRLVLKRVPWLITLLMLGTITTLVMNFYYGVKEGITESATTLFPAIIGIYIPIIIGTGGNTGGQSSTLIIRGLATGEVHFRDIGKILLKELLVGLLLSFMIGIVIFGRCMLFPPQASLLQATAITSSLVMVVIIANLVGAIAPLLISKMKMDPAVMSTPLMSTVIDVCGLVIYFEMAKAFLL